MEIESNHQQQQTETTDGELMKDVPPISPEAVDKFVKGFTDVFLPEAESNKQKLDELLLNQSVVLETLQQENAKFKECTTFNDIQQTMLKARVYYGKLCGLRREMNSLHDRTSKLRRRAVKLQQQRQKEFLQLEQKREKEMEREQQLMAKQARPVQRGGLLS
ncbi:biogenesis of lysosome-related organelles complex 1 subunit 6-like [Tubulanus polymorphus]|uniref:biogenesis of lysosome-related organelles complex 1 subunit 6-like n=1 Tax=Tubulanus polymorphus TaxID=672921 RepID=UPI003DA1DB88